MLFPQGYTVLQGCINFNGKVSVWHIFVTCGPFLLLPKEDAKLKKNNLSNLKTDAFTQFHL